jgi:uncharacterized protein
MLGNATGSARRRCAAKQDSANRDVGRRATGRVLQSTALLLALLVVPARPSVAASFDCAKAATAVEKMICTDPALSKADEALGEAFAAALAADLNRRELRTAQLKWLGTRGQASSAADMLVSYQRRIDSLLRTTEQWRSVPKEIAAATASTSCLVFPEAPDGAKCSVREFAAIAGATEPALFYQLQSYADGDVNTAAGVVVFQAVAGKASALTPRVALASEGAHYEAPEINATPGTRLLIVPGELEGTGHINIESIYLISKDRLEDVDADSWVQDLGRRVPKGMTANKGIFPDYRAMTAATPLWRSGDGNCCPTGGRAFVTLALTGHRLMIKAITVKLGEAAARDDEPAVSASPAPAPQGDTTVMVCGAPASVAINTGSFRNGPAADDPQALETAGKHAAGLIEKAFEALCAQRQLTRQEIAAKVRRISIGWAGGADNFAAYFPKEKGKAGTLAAEWVWSGTELPAIDDIGEGILCAFRPQRKICAERIP